MAISSYCLNFPNTLDSDLASSSAKSVQVQHIEMQHKGWAQTQFCTTTYIHQILKIQEWRSQSFLFSHTAFSGGYASVFHFLLHTTATTLPHSLPAHKLFQIPFVVSSFKKKKKKNQCPNQGKHALKDIQ